MHHCQCSASPNQSLSKCSSRCGRLAWMPRKHLRFQEWQTLENLCKKPRKTHLKSLDFHQMRFRNEDVSQLHTTSAPKIRSKTRLPLCSSAVLLRPYCAPRTHLQIKEAEAIVLLFTRSISLYSPLGASPMWANPRVTLSKPSGKLEPTTCTTSRCYKRTLISTQIWQMYIFNIGCFLQKHPAGENKDFDSESVENVCGNGANRLKKAQKHLDAGRDKWPKYISIKWS